MFVAGFREVHSPTKTLVGNFEQTGKIRKCQSLRSGLYSKLLNNWPDSNLSNARITFCRHLCTNASVLSFRNKGNASRKSYMHHPNPSEQRTASNTETPQSHQQ